MSVNYNPKIVTDGLVFCLDAGNTKSYPGSGTTWSDLSGNRNNGTLVNGTAYDSANNGSLVFDGIDDYVSIGDITILNNTLNGATNWSICYWCNATTDGRILDRGDLVNDPTGALELNTNNISRNNTSGGTASMNVSVLNAGWKYVGLTRTDALLATWYLNGAQRNSVQMTESYDGAGIWKIGRRAYSTSAMYTGKIAQITIYNRLLSASEIAQNFNATRGRFSA